MNPLPYPRSFPSNICPGSGPAPRHFFLFLIVEEGRPGPESDWLEFKLFISEGFLSSLCSAFSASTVNKDTEKPKHANAINIRTKSILGIFKLEKRWGFFLKKIYLWINKNQSIEDLCLLCAFFRDQDSQDFSRLPLNMAANRGRKDSLPHANRHYHNPLGKWQLLGKGRVPKPCGTS